MGPPEPPTTPHEPLRRFIERTGARCVSCGYDLRGIDAARCPECGAELSLPVLMAADATFRKRPRRVVWSVGVLWLGFGALAGLRPPGVGLGFGGVELFVLVVGATVAGAGVLVIDRSIFDDRIRDDRARTVPSFGVAVNIWCVAMLGAGAAMAGWVAWMWM